MWYTKNNLRIAQAQPDKLTQFKNWLKDIAPLFSNYIKAVSDDFDIKNFNKEFQYTLTDDSTHIQSLDEISKTGIRLTRVNKDNILQKADPGEAPKAGNVSGYVDDKGYSYTQELNANKTEFVQPASNNTTTTNSTPTSQAKQEPTLLPDFEKNDTGQIKLKDGSKPTLESNLQKEAQQMGLSTNKFSNRFNNNINEQDYYKQIIMNHINNGQVTNYTPESRRMIADQILSERREKRNIEQRMRGILSRPKSVDFKPVNDILFGIPIREPFSTGK
jgi:uncharacterized protein YeaO (DUF488 family)